MKQEQEQQEVRRYLSQAGVVESGRGYLTVKEIAQYLSMKTSTLYSWVPQRYYIAGGTAENYQIAGKKTAIMFNRLGSK
jgi:transposase-like protein